MNNYRIVVADSAENSRKKICTLLNRKGYKTYQATDGAGAIRISRSIKPDIVIIDTNIWGIHAFEVADIIEEDKLSTVIFVTNKANSDLYDQLKKMTIFAYITKPIMPDQMYQTIEFAIMNSSRIQTLSLKVEKLECNLKSRKIIDRAKGLIMEQLSMSENDAYNHIRKKSMDACISMDIMAERIIKKYLK